MRFVPLLTGVGRQGARVLLTVGLVLAALSSSVPPAPAATQMNLKGTGHRRPFQRQPHTVGATGAARCRRSGSQSSATRSIGR